MADRWLFAGGGIETLRTVAGTPVANTVGGTYNTSYADHSVHCTSANRAAADFVDSSGASDYAGVGEKLYVSFSANFLSSNTTLGNVVELFDDLDQPWLAIRYAGSSGTFALFYNSGTGGSPSWTLVHAATATFVSSRKEISVWITLGSPHTAGWAVNGSLIAEASFTQASLTRLDALLIRAQTTGNTSYSEIQATVGISTVGSHVYYGKATGAGSNSGFSGTFADIDDVGITDADGISSGTAAQRSTFAYSNVPTLGANEALGDVFLYTRARNSGGAPSNVAPVRRDSGGTDNVGSCFSGISGAYQTFLTRYSGLTETEYNASEFGVESAT